MKEIVVGYVGSAEAEHALLLPRTWPRGRARRDHELASLSYPQEGSSAPSETTQSADLHDFEAL
jgi:hypothetical protein